MKSFFLVLSIMFTSVSFANCKFHVESDFRALQDGKNGTFWAINKVLSEKGYERVHASELADVLVNLDIDLERSGKENLLTIMKDLVDSDNESDYVLTYKQVTKLKVSHSNEEILTGSITKKGKTIENTNDHDLEVAERAVIDGAKLIESLPNCSE